MCPERTLRRPGMLPTYRDSSTGLEASTPTASLDAPGHGPCRPSHPPDPDGRQAAAAAGLRRSLPRRTGRRPRRHGRRDTRSDSCSGWRAYVFPRIGARPVNRCHRARAVDTLCSRLVEEAVWQIEPAADADEIDSLHVGTFVVARQHERGGSSADVGVVDRAVASLASTSVHFETSVVRPQPLEQSAERVRPHAARCAAPSPVGRGIERTNRSADATSPRK